MNIETVAAIFRRNMSTLAAEAEAARRRPIGPSRREDINRKPGLTD